MSTGVAPYPYLAVAVEEWSGLRYAFPTGPVGPLLVRAATSKVKEVDGAAKLERVFQDNFYLAMRESRGGVA